MRHDFDISSGVWGDSMSVNCSYHQQLTFSTVHSRSCLLLPHPAGNPVRWAFSPSAEYHGHTPHRDTCDTRPPQPCHFPIRLIPALLSRRDMLLTAVWARDSYLSFSIPSRQCLRSHSVLQGFTPFIGHIHPFGHVANEEEPRLRRRNRLFAIKLLQPRLH